MQKRAAIAVCWIAFLLPAQAPAMDLDYPALGLKLTHLPDGAKSSGVGERLMEDQVQILFAGNTSATISRLDEPVPQGNIADEKYRDALLKQLGIHLSGRALPVVLIGGQPAWGNGYTEQFGSITTYQCFFYLVVGAHFYEITIRAAGDKPDPTSASFDAAANDIISDLAFEPVQPLPEKPLAAGEMPKFLMGSSTDDYYPDRARALGEQGVVDVEFSIDGSGAAQGVKVTNHAYRDLSDAALSMLRASGFKIPQGWEQSGASKGFFTMEFRFELTPDGSCPPTQPPRRPPIAEVLTTCSAAIRRP